MAISTGAGAVPEPLRCTLIPRGSMRLPLSATELPVENAANLIQRLMLQFDLDNNIL